MPIQWNSVTWYSKLVAVILFVLVLALGFYLGCEYQKVQSLKIGTAVPTTGAGAEKASGSADYKDISYVLEGDKMKLVDLDYFGNEARGDLNGDGREDVAFLIAKNFGGTGTFFYTLVALKTADGYAGTNAVMLGDRIAPQTTQIKDGVLIVNYTDRGPGEPMVADPSVGKSKYMKVNGAVLSELAGK